MRPPSRPSRAFFFGAGYVAPLIGRTLLMGRRGQNALAARVRMMERTLATRVVGDTDALPITALVIEAAGQAYGALLLGSTTHSLSAAIRLARGSKCINGCLADRLQRIGKAADILRHATAYSVRATLAELHELCARVGETRPGADEFDISSEKDVEMLHHCDCIFCC